MLKSFSEVNEFILSSASEYSSTPFTYATVKINNSGTITVSTQE